MSAFIVGIDPGFEGAIAFLRLRVGHPDYIHDMPVIPGAKGKTELNHLVLDSILDKFHTGGPTTVWLEKVGSMPGNKAQSMFRFGQQVGALEMAAVANGHSLRYVTPTVWKSYFGLSKDKGVARGYASKRFPELAPLFARAKDDGRAEATLIALYGREHQK